MKYALHNADMIRPAVTPRAGVWIEIAAGEGSERPPGSLPVRECGLKFEKVVFEAVRPRVTPRAGVWIEIITICNAISPAESLPVRECGLK